MSTSARQKPGNQLWGIYHTDREYAHSIGDPLRTVVKASTRLVAEELAAQLGFSEPLAERVTPETVKRGQWLPRTKRRPMRRNARGVRV
jgi:hypothetical protein